MLNVSGRVKKALLERGWTQKKLCGEIEVTETGFKRMSENNTWKLETLDKIAAVLDLPIVYFFDEGENYELGRTKVLSGDQEKSDGDDYLRGHIANLEESFRRLSERFDTELSAKNQQIAGLQRTVDALVGKSEGATNNPLSFDEFSMEVMYHYYTQATYKNLIMAPVPSRQLTAHR